LRAPENPDAAGFTLRLDDTHLLTVADADPGPDEVRILEAFGRELAAALELEELQAEASTAASLASAGEFRAAILSAVSHDLRTPIAAIKASVSSLLQEDVSWTNEARREFLDTIDEEVDRLNGLVGNLLDMSRLQAGAVEVRREPIGLDEVVPAALRSLGGTADGVDVDVPESLPRVLADAGLLERALANIVGNAVRHSPEGRRVRLLAGRANGGVDIRVVDCGEGVAVARREEMFLPFQRLGDSGDDDGVGLGLAVAKGFVEAMGGDIEVEETPGGGLTMVVRLEASG
jgi:two-component system sensor histidine kinase KdpD